MSNLTNPYKGNDEKSSLFPQMHQYPLQTNDDAYANTYFYKSPFPNQNPAAPNVAEHVHVFFGTTSYEDGHEHRYAGTTAPAKNVVHHTHKFLTTTTFVDGHRHYLIGETGPAIPLPDGGHTHEYNGITTGYTVHEHAYSGYTSIVDTRISHITPDFAPVKN